MTHIVTLSGIQFDLENFSEDAISIHDIAAALSKLCRFTGHCKEFYSVAQHCVIGSDFVSKENKLAFMLHDASEAYLADIAKPHKSLLPEYQERETRLQGLICEKFRVTFPFVDEIHDIDQRMMATEIRQLTHFDESLWGEYIQPEPLDVLIEPWGWRRAYAEYFVRLHSLLEEHGDFRFS